MGLWGLLSTNPETHCTNIRTYIFTYLCTYVCRLCPANLVRDWKAKFIQGQPLLNQETPVNDTDVNLYKLYIHTLRICTIRKDHVELYEAKKTYNKCT